MTTTSVSLQDANGNPIVMAVVQLANGLAAAHVFCNAAGVPYSAANPLLTAPAIYAADFASHVDTIAVAGAVVRDTPVNPARSGGYIQAGSANTGKITVILYRGDGTTLVSVLQASDRLPLTVAPGKVLQQRFTIAGDTVTDTVTSVEYL